MIELRRDGTPVDSFYPEYINTNIVIGIDSSKTNSAIVIGDERGSVYHDYEISGEGVENYVYDVCRVTRIQLKKLLQGANIKVVAIEDIITKKDGKYSEGLKMHQSRAMITAIFNNYVFIFDEFFNIMPVFINNETWKSTILPQQYRVMDGKKGSKKWFVDLRNKWAGRKDDVTDAVCIYWYIVQVSDIQVTRSIDMLELPQYKYRFFILPTEYKTNKNDVQFTVNNDGTFIENVETMVNHIGLTNQGFFYCNTEFVPPELLMSEHVKKTKYPFPRRAYKLLIYIKIKR